MLVSVPSVFLAGALALAPSGGGGLSVSPASSGGGPRAPADSLSVQARLRGSAAEAALLVPPTRGFRRSVTVLQPSDIGPTAAGLRSVADTGDGAPADPQLVEYSDAYFTRLTIHRWASYLTLPLFVSEYVVGQKLIHGEGSDRLRSVHGALAGGIGALFLVNTVTGGLNALEARKDPVERNRRTLHSVLMLLADAGFVATAALAGEREDEGGGFESRPLTSNAHRNMAIASMGTALVGYAIMLPFFRED